MTIREAQTATGLSYERIRAWSDPKTARIRRREVEVGKRVRVQVAMDDLRREVALIAAIDDGAATASDVAEADGSSARHDANDGHNRDRIATLEEIIRRHRRIAEHQEEIDRHHRDVAREYREIEALLLAPSDPPVR